MKYFIKVNIKARNILYEIYRPFNNYNTVIVQNFEVMSGKYKALEVWGTVN
jgi:hypothetical protein